VSLPDGWVAALRWVATESDRLRLPYAIVGSLGAALSLGLPWEPTGPPRDGALSPRDLDVFLLGDERTRRTFVTGLRSHHPDPGGPKKVEVVAMYHLLTEFGPSGCALRYRRLRMPLDPKLLAPWPVAVAGMLVPVLHPRAHIHLIGMQPRVLAKGLARVRSMERALARGLDALPGIEERECRVFHRFKRARRERYPLHERVLAARLVLDGWEHAGRWTPIVAVKVHLRRHHPRVTNALRRLLD
jgi:hypothetical protein